LKYIKIMTVKELNKYYTDPILYEEGIFKDKADEAGFLTKVELFAKKLKVERLAKQKTA
jgi:hypothetical protein